MSRPLPRATPWSLSAHQRNNLNETFPPLTVIFLSHATREIARKNKTAAWRAKLALDRHQSLRLRQRSAPPACSTKALLRYHEIVTEALPVGAVSCVLSVGSRFKKEE
jgi:hypothetical protein